jgi:dihydrofolate reductase
MGRILQFASVSLDGFMSGPDGELDWHVVDEEVHTYFNDVLGTAGAYLEGRVNHEMMVEHWPDADEAPDVSPAEAEFAAIWRATPQYVFSRTRTELPWATEVLPEVDPAWVRDLADRTDGDIIVGGATLAATFRELDLIDDLRISIVPVVLGAGRPLFPPADRRTWFELADTKVFSNGLVHLHYTRP